MKNLSATAISVLTQLDAARLEGQEWVELNVGYGHKAFEAMIAAQQIEAGPGGVYRITQAGSLALVAGQYEPVRKSRQKGHSKIRPLPPPAPANGHSQSTDHHASACPAIARTSGCSTLSPRAIPPSEICSTPSSVLKG